GKLYRANALQDNGAPLLPVTDLPISLSRNVPYIVNLSFALSPRYLQIIEEQRALQQEQVVALSMQMWGTVAMVKPRGNVTGVSYHLQSLSCEVIRFEKVSTDDTVSSVRIERSAWVDRILPGLGYRRSVLIELPLIRT